MNMKKVGLVSVSIHNYGSLLQTYAMQHILDKLGIDNEIILFKSHPIKQFYRIFNPTFLSMKMKLYKRKLICRLKYPEITIGTKVRDKEFINFKKNYCRFTSKTTSRKELNKMGIAYEAFVLGSDQVWNPANLEMDFYTLNFVPQDKTKIAYAPSFGVSQIPDKQKVATIAYLKRVQYISVRESAGAKIVEDLIGCNVPVVCDPTALLTVDDWNQIRSKKKYINEKYIFCYFLGANPTHRRFAEAVKEKTGCKIVALQHLDEFVKGDLKFGDLTPYDVGPQDFVNLLSNAEMVLTDSFHGTMFSIYYHKNFFTFSRFDDSKKESTNSRIVSILNLMGLSERKLDATENVDECLSKTIDWEAIQKELQVFRRKSYKWLVESLHKGGVI